MGEDDGSGGVNVRWEFVAFVSGGTEPPAKPLRVTVASVV
jgi:hypothetical protein